MIVGVVVKKKSFLFLFETVEGAPRAPLPLFPVQPVVSSSVNGPWPALGRTRGCNTRPVPSAHWVYPHDAPNLTPSGPTQTRGRLLVPKNIIVTPTRPMNKVWIGKRWKRNIRSEIGMGKYPPPLLQSPPLYNPPPPGRPSLGPKSTGNTRRLSFFL